MANSFLPVGVTSANLSRDVTQDKDENLGANFWGPAPLKFPDAQLRAILNYF